MGPIFLLIILAASFVTGQSNIETTTSTSSGTTTTTGTTSTPGQYVPIAPHAAGLPVSGIASLLGAPEMRHGAIMPAVMSAGPELVVSTTTQTPSPSPESSAPEIGGRRRAMGPEIVPESMLIKVAMTPEPSMTPSPSPTTSSADSPMPPAVGSGLLGLLSPPQRPLPLVDPVELQVKPMRSSIDAMTPQVVPPGLPQVIPPGPPQIDETAPAESLPDDVKLLKAIIAKKDETINSLNSEVSEMRNKCDRPGPIGIMPQFMPPPCDCNNAQNEDACANLVRMKDDEIEGLRDRLRELESKQHNVKKYSPGNKKPLKKQIEIVVQKKKNLSKKIKTSNKLRVSTVNPNAGCISLLENEKSITSALQAGINERDIQITSLQEMLKNAEDRVSIIQNAEVNACNVKMQNAASEMNNCKEDIKSLKRLTANCGERYTDAIEDEDDDDDDDDDDENDSELMSLVHKIMANGKKGNIAVIKVHKKPLSIKKRIENKISVITLGEKEYYFHNVSRATWKNAKLNCEKHKMRLISIEHDEENAMVSNEVTNTGGVYWTSGRDNSGRGDFEWTAIKRSFNNFLNWAPGQPEVGNPKRKCVDVGPFGSDGAMWKVSDCNMNLHYICERTVREG